MRLSASTSSRPPAPTTTAASRGLCTSKRPSTSWPRRFTARLARRCLRSASPRRRCSAAASLRSRWDPACCWAAGSRARSIASRSPTSSRTATAANWCSRSTATPTTTATPPPAPTSTSAFSRSPCYGGTRNKAMNWKYLINDLKKALTPAGMAAFIKSHKYTLAISGVFSIIGVLMFVYVDLVGSRSAIFKLVRDYELKTLDSRFILRGTRKGDERIVIVAIDQETINRLRWPFPRFQHAKLLDILCKDGARAIGMDIFFPFKDPTAPANVLNDLQKQMTDLGYPPDAAAFS